MAVTSQASDGPTLSSHPSTGLAESTTTARDRKFCLREPHAQASVAIFVLSLALLAAMTHDCVFMAGNDASRFAHIESLVDFGQAHIDDSRYAWTVDKVRINGRYYSNKPPAMALAGAVAYKVLQSADGYTFRNAEARVVRWLTVVLVGIPTAWLIALFFWSLGLHARISPAVQWLTTLALGAGTILTSFSVTFNNHTVAAALLFTAFFAVVRGHPLSAGLFGGLAVCVDVVPGLGLAPALLWIALANNRLNGLFRATLGYSLCAIVFLAANKVTVGSFWLPKLVPGAVDSSSSFASSAGGVLLPDTWQYPISCLFGGHGFFTVSPVLLFGAIGLITACRSRCVFPTSWSKWIAAAVAVQILGHILFVGSYGGWSYGFRYLIPVVPFLLFFAPCALGPIGTRVFAAILPASMVAALLGVYHPWPPAFEQEALRDPIPSLVRNPVAGNAAAWLDERFPNSWIAREAGSLFISHDAGLRRRYLQLFDGSRCGSDRFERHRRTTRDLKASRAVFQQGQQFTPSL